MINVLLIGKPLVKVQTSFTAQLQFALHVPRGSTLQVPTLQIKAVGNHLSLLTTS